MSNHTADDVFKLVHDMKTEAQENASALRNELGETREVSEKAILLAEQAVEALKEHGRQFPGPGVPMSNEQAKYVNQAGGLFEGKRKMSHEKMLGISPLQKSLRPQDSERLKGGQDLHDECMVRYWHVHQQNPHLSKQECTRMAADKYPVFERYAAWLESAGFEKAANDILNPAGGTGANLDWTLMSTQMVDLVRLESDVAKQFPQKPLSDNEQEFTALRADTKSRLGGQLTTYGIPTNDPALPGTFPQATMLLLPTFGKVKFNCIHNVGAIGWNDDMIEDSAIDVLSEIRAQGPIMLARGRDDAIISGVRTGTGHIDSDVTDAYDSRRFWHGLRYMGANNHETITAAILAADINKLMARLGKWAKRLPNLVLFLSVKDWVKLASDPLLAAANTIGLDRATLREGVIDRVYGVDIVVSEYIRRDLNASGVYDGVTTTNTIEILVDRSRFWNGVRHTVKVEEVRVPQALAGWLQVDVREDFQALDKDNTTAQFPAGDAPIAIAEDVTS